MRGEKVQRLEKRLLFVTKVYTHLLQQVPRPRMLAIILQLRDGCVNVLNSYRLESGVDELLKQNLAEVSMCVYLIHTLTPLQVERQLASANERIAELEVCSV